LISVFSALRLAKFNNDTRQADSFIGLPTPANAILIASLPLIVEHYTIFSKYILNQYILTVFVLVMCALLVAEIPMMSLKFKNTDFNKNIYRYLLLLFSAILILFFKFAAVPVVIFIYITLSIIQFKFSNDTVVSSHRKTNKT
jgi:CDP-diacylglycerol--serine O-phosphatidyltransferase